MTTTSLPAFSGRFATSTAACSREARPEGTVVGERRNKGGAALKPALGVAALSNPLGICCAGLYLHRGALILRHSPLPLSNTNPSTTPSRSLTSRPAAPAPPRRC